MAASRKKCTSAHFEVPARTPQACGLRGRRDGGPRRGARLRRRRRLSPALGAAPGPRGERRARVAIRSARIGRTLPSRLKARTFRVRSWRSGQFSFAPLLRFITPGGPTVPLRTSRRVPAILFSSLRVFCLFIEPVYFFRRIAVLRVSIKS